MSEAVTKTIVGVCGEISEKNGWTAFHIDHGRDYPTKLSTKKTEIIEKARAVGDQTATWTFKESDSENINEKTGKPFVNRYLDKVELGEHAPSTSNTGSTPAPQRAVQGTYDVISEGDKDRAIVRQTCLKASAALLQGVQFQNEAQRVAAWMSAAAAAERHVYRNIEEDDSLDGDDVPF